MAKPSWLVDQRGLTAGTPAAHWQARHRRIARVSLPPARRPAGIRARQPAGCHKSAWPVNCIEALGAADGMMIGRVPSPAIPDLRPALRLAGPARPVNG